MKQVALLEPGFIRKWDNLESIKRFVQLSGIENIKNISIVLWHNNFDFLFTKFIVLFFS